MTVTSAPTGSRTVSPESACVSRLSPTADGVTAGVTAAEGKAVVGVGRGPAEAGAVVGVGPVLAQAVLAEAELAAAAASPDWAVAQPAMPASPRAAMAAAAGTHVRYMYCLTRATGLWFRLALTLLNGDERGARAVT